MGEIIIPRFILKRIEICILFFLILLCHCIYSNTKFIICYKLHIKDMKVFLEKSHEIYVYDVPLYIKTLKCKQS